ncbi:hypothetical protein E4T38_00084 [Aureobasidium subglaciale]|nr:hypothetical protein E4T38_00084 [Aureobasidium subglaciale]KAI5232567.1 hypothetical protein E4T40_00084 [Aureobasidium subglaciale]KAI5234746.1 hypothetical protein E4T41_00084 [Aureobasidium subglaciale]KAI5268354.1 hypothetical protein E4T46_00084 [Aureobasidium subglaciale]
MASRAMSMPARRLATSLSTPVISRRSFQSSAHMLQVVPAGAMPVRKPVGAFRGGILGFLSGAVLSGGALYYYVIDEYRVSNELLTEDIYALQSAVSRIEGYVKSLEEKARK